MISYSPLTPYSHRSSGRLIVLANNEAIWAMRSHFVIPTINVFMNDTLSDADISATHRPSSSLGPCAWRVVRGARGGPRSPSGGHRHHLCSNGPRHRPAGPCAAHGRHGPPQ